MSEWDSNKSISDLQVSCVSIELCVQERDKRISQLEERLKIATDALEFYADDKHIREHGNGQTVMLEAEECEPKNTALLALEKIRELDGK